MGNRSSSASQRDRLPYQGQPGELVTATQPQASQLYGAAPARANGGEERPIYQWVLQRAAETTRGVARVDLVRPRLPPVKDEGSLWTTSAEEGRVSYPSVYSRRPADAYSRMRRTQFGGGGSAFDSEESGLLGFGAARGARIKLMRCIDIGGQEIDSDKQRAVIAEPERPVTEAGIVAGLNDGVASAGVLGKVAGAFKPESPRRLWGSQPRKPPLLSFGIGGSIEMDQLAVLPQMRIRFQDWATLKLVPAPVLKLQKRLRLPNSSLALRLRYEVPLEAIDDFYRPPARLLVRLENDVGTGVHLSASGIDFDQRVLQLGRETSVRFAGHASFPRQIPVPEGRQLVDLDITRLGLKTSW